MEGPSEEPHAAHQVIAVVRMLLSRFWIRNSFSCTCRSFLHNLIIGLFPITKRVFSLDITSHTTVKMVSLKSLLVTATMVAVSLAKDYYIDPDSVPLSTRQNWCNSETSTCPLICQQTTDKKTLVNECNPKTLSYGCLCGDNKQPNISEYTLTLPFFICQEYVVQCRNNCGGDNTCASNCAEENPCGATDPKRYNTTATATQTTAESTSTTAGPDTIFTGTPGGGSSSSSGKGKSMAAPAVEVGRAYGLAVLLGTMFVGFAML
ncbi:hypothetical protein TgHK011_007397 [Trichoderma gracile]|nr:hypothetical protein TgHK011_007397 [Trichoderma gracile]